MSTTIDENLLLFSSKFTEQKEYWANKLSGDLVENKLFADNKIAASPGGDKKKLEIYIPDELSERMLKLGKNSDLSIYMLLVTGLKVLMHRYTGNEDSVIISPLYKPKMTAETLNECVFIRDDVHSDMTFRDLLLKNRQSTLEAYENQDYPFDKLVQYLFDSGRVRGNNIVSNIMCSFNNIHDEDAMEPERYSLAFKFIREGEQIKGDIQYDPDLYDEYYITQSAQHLIKIMQESLQDINTKISEVSFISDSEKEQLLVHFNDTETAYSREKTIQELFEECAEKTPEQIAAADLENERRTITYKRLNEKANRLARKLREKGVGPDSIVAIISGRSIEMIISILGILKAGGAYMPIDPDYPETRKKILLEDSGAKVLLTVKRLFEENKTILHRIARENVLFTDDETIYTGPANNPEIINAPEHLAYIIYTSGTTGKPKGAMLNHRNVVNLVCGLNKRIYSRYDTTLNIALIAPFIFDASVKQIFASLLLGHALYIVPECARIDAQLLSEFYKENNIDISDGTPTHLSMLFEIMGDDPEFDVKHFVIGGEPLTWKIVDDFYSCFKEKTPLITNVYGPTECCVDATSFQVAAEELPALGRFNQIPIGKPMPNYRIYILDKDDFLKPMGVAGEICIGGEGVGRGYLKREQLTHQKFTPDPFAGEQNADKKIYRTGDLGRWLPDGSIEFLGRMDQQVKLRGYRIELEEIKTLLTEHRKIKEAVVTTKEAANGDKYICAYLVPDENKTMEDDEAQQVAGKKIASHREFALKELELTESPGGPLFEEYTAGENKQSLLEYVEEQARENNDKTALKSENGDLDFHNVNRSANRLAHTIVQQYDDRYQLNEEERTRYLRQMLLDGWGVEHQEILKSSTIAVIGCGGIGSPIITQFALLGIGTIVCCDYDDVELSNLNRQFLHDHSRIGMNKALSAQMTVNRTNPNVRVIAYQEKVTRESIERIAGDANVIFDCVDDLETKFIIS
ncbi:MAG: amino acid adenylation domain-containing protein, partial [bacterium]|nr:amino acid adenylation domain-containing protein [bacterium]